MIVNLRCIIEDRDKLERQNAAIRILVDAVGLAQSKGVFNLDQASLVASAVREFVVPPPEGAQAQETQQG